MSSRYQGLVSGEIHRILRDLSKLALEVRNDPRSVSPSLLEKAEETKSVSDGSVSPSNNDPPRKSVESQPRTTDSSSYECEVPLKDYPNDYPIEDFVSEIAMITRRPLDKANEWLLKLKAQDIITVGDLRHLHDEDWTQLNLTVFACRSIRNALQAKPKPVLASLQNQATIKPLLKNTTILEDPHELLTSTSPVLEGNTASPNNNNNLS